MRDMDVVATIGFCFVCALVSAWLTAICFSQSEQEDCKNYGQHNSGVWHMTCTRIK